MNPRWLLIGIVGLAVVNTLIRSDPDERRDRLVAIAWGGALALVTYFLWSWYDFADVRGGWSWATGDGLPYVGALFVLGAGYVWYDAARDADGDPEAFVDGLRDRTAGPVLQVVGILSAIVVTLLTLATTTGTETALILGMFGDAFANAPLAASNLVTIALGYLALEGPVPLIGEFVPELSRTWFVGLSVSALGLALMVRNSGDRS